MKKRKNITINMVMTTENIGIEKIMTVEKKRFVVNVAKSLGEDILKME